MATTNERGSFVTALVISHAGLALLTLFQTAALGSFFGGAFSTWWSQGLLLLPTLIAIPMGVAWFRRRAVLPYMICSTAYWLFASTGYLLTLLEEGDLIAGHASGAAGVAVAVSSLIYLGRLARSQEPRDAPP